MKKSILIVAFVVVTGCNRTPPELVGTWIGRGDFTASEIATASSRLSDAEWKHTYGADGKFLSIFKDKASASGIETRGTWKLISIDDNKVTFETSLALESKTTDQVSTVTVEFDGPDRFQASLDGHGGIALLIFEREKHQ